MKNALNMFAAYSAPPDPIAGIKGPSSQAKGRKRDGRHSTTQRFTITPQEVIASYPLPQGHSTGRCGWDSVELLLVHALLFLSRSFTVQFEFLCLSFQTVAGGVRQTV